MKRHITLIRHGSLPERAAGRLIGNDEVPLSELGEREAAAIGRYLGGRCFDAVYSGTLTRVRQTRALASEFAPALRTFREDARLNELDFGQWSWLNKEEVDARWPGMFETWDFGNPAFAAPGGESVADFTTRTRAVFADILASGAERIAVVSHGGVIMSLLADWIGVSRSMAFQLHVVRGALAELYDSGDMRMIRAIARPLDFE